MFCPKCGREIADNALFCTYCGTRVAPEEPSAAVPAAPEAAPMPEPVAAEAAAPVPEQTAPVPEAAAPAPETEIPAPTVPSPETAIPALETAIPAPEMLPEQALPAQPALPPEQTESRGLAAAALPPVNPPQNTAPAAKPEKYYTFGHIALCLCAVAVMAIVAGVFAGLYFSVR